MSSPAEPVSDTPGLKQEINADVISRMTGPEFETLVAGLFVKLGFQVEMTQASHDGGIDLIAHCHVPLLQGKYIIQCKRYDGSVGEPFVRDLFGVMTSERANKGILVTNSTFTPSALQFAAGKPLELIDGDRLIGMLAREGIVSVEQTRPSFEKDQEIARLQKLIAAIPDELRWRVQLARHVMGVVEFPHTASSRDEIMPYVGEAEIQLSAIYEICHAYDGLAFKHFERVITLRLGYLQLLQGRLEEAVKWMIERPRLSIWIKGLMAQPRYTGSDSDTFMETTINLANIAAFCGKPLIRQRIIERYDERIKWLVERWKQFFMHLLQSQEQDPNAVDYFLNRMKKIEGIRLDYDIFFHPTRIDVGFDSINKDKSADFPEMPRHFQMDSLSEMLSPTNRIMLEDRKSPLSYGDDVENALLPYLAWIEA